MLSLDILHELKVVSNLSNTLSSIISLGLYGKDVKEAAQCDIVYEGLNDIIAKLNTYRHATPENKVHLNSLDGD